MKILPQKDGMDGFFATVLKRKWFFVSILFIKKGDNLKFNFIMIRQKSKIISFIKISPFLQFCLNSDHFSEIKVFEFHKPKFLIYFIRIIYLDDFFSFFTKSNADIFINILKETKFCTFIIKFTSWTFSLIIWLLIWFLILKTWIQFLLIRTRWSCSSDW